MTSEKNDFRSKLAKEFIDVLKMDDWQWKHGWNKIKFYNPKTKSIYKGVNEFALGLSASRNKFKDPRWLTFNQIQDFNKDLESDKKLKVKKDSKGTKIEYWMAYDLKEKKVITLDEKTKLITENQRENHEFKPISKEFTVFNAEQIENMPEFEFEQENDFDLNHHIETLPKHMGITIEESIMSEASYSPTYDLIRMPNKRLFYSEDEYHLTLLHELTHATGHPSRLNRKIDNFFATKAYAFEELIAEIGAALMGVTYLDNLSQERIENQKAYVKGWIELLEDKPHALATAIHEATKASDYMIGLLNNENEKQLLKDVQSDEEILKKVVKKDSKQKQSEIINDTISILDYAASELGLKVKKIGSTYGTSEFESLRIYEKTNSFYWFSHEIGGGAIEFIKAFHPEAQNDRNKAIQLAKKYVVDNNLSRLLKYNPNYKSKSALDNFQTKLEYMDYLTKFAEYKNITPEIPPKADTNDKIIHYLIDQRKIAPAVVAKWIEDELIYQDIKGNLAFVGKDFNGDIKYTQIKGLSKLSSGKSFVQDTKGSSKSVAVCMYNKQAKNIYITEAVIDAMSIQTMTNSLDDTILSIQGAANYKAVLFFLSTHNIHAAQNIYLCLDNDEAGKKGVEKIKSLLQQEGKYYSIDKDKIHIEVITPKMKDFNDSLVHQHELELER